MRRLPDFKEHRLFRDVSAESLDKLLEVIKPSSLAAGEVLFRPGDRCGWLYVLLEGTVKTYTVSSDGRESILHVFHPGEAFGVILFAGSPAERPWAQALSDALLLTIEEREFRRCMIEVPDFCINVFQYLVKHHTGDMDRMAAMIHSKASHRLLRTLMLLGRQLGHDESDNFPLTSGLTHEDLANMIGVSRSTVSELIGHLRANGVLSGRGRDLTFHRKAAERFLKEG